MKTLTDIKIDKFPLDNLFKIGDLVNYDGPLLSLFSNPQRELYLYDWVDGDKHAHRWLIYRVTPAQLRAYLKRRLTHYELITSTQSVLLIDLDSKIEPQNIILLTTKNLPADYLPEEEVLHDDDESPHLTQIQRYLDELESQQVLSMTVWQFIRAELRPGRPPEGVAKTLPPMVVWRFKKPQPALESAIQDAVKQFHGQIAWELGNKRNAWALYPRRVREVTEANKLAGLLGGLDLLMGEEPEFGMLANEEFEELTAFLQKVINPTLLQEYDKNAGWP